MPLSIEAALIGRKQGGAEDASPCNMISEGGGCSMILDW